MLQPTQHRELHIIYGKYWEIKEGNKGTILREDCKNDLGIIRSRENKTQEIRIRSRLFRGNKGTFEKDVVRIADNFTTKP